MLYFYSSLILFVPTVLASLTYKGVDWSSFTVESEAGKKYSTSSGATEDLQTIFSGSGVKTVRQRVWVNPSDGEYDLDYNLALGKLANAAGLGIYLDLHFSDTWADPSHQATPTGWPSDIDDLAWEVYNYTQAVCNAFSDASLPVSIVSIGNEITAGLLWPLGALPNYANIARLLHSASAGIKDSTLSTIPKIMIHLDNGWEWSTQEWWYTTMLAAGDLTLDDFDIMGVSYYPFYNSEATLASLKTSLTNMASTWSKSLIVAETDWPTSCPDPKYSFPSDASSIPFTAAGQTTWVEDVAKVVSAVSGGEGLFYWEPAWLDNAGLGSSCANNLMFSSTGEALSSLAVFSSI